VKPISKAIAAAFLFLSMSANSASTSNFHGMFSATPFFHFSTFSDVVKVNISLNQSGSQYEYHNTNDQPYGTGLKVCWKKNSFAFPETTCHYNIQTYNIHTTEIMLGDALGVESNTNYILTIEAHSTKTSHTDFEPGEEEWHNANDGMIGNLDRRWREVARFEIVTQRIGPRFTESQGNSPLTEN